MSDKTGISIIVTAYKAQNFIEQTLNSIQQQSWIKSNKNYEIILGIDHCEDTLNKVKSIMNNYKNLTVIYMDKNVGTYITSNTLISLTKYNWILRFDSDDIMKEDMIESVFNLIEVCPNTDIIQFYYKNFSSDKSIKQSKGLAHGVICANKKIFNAYGCYMPWKCAADTELLTRLNKFAIIKDIPKILFYRRIHSQSLTQNRITDMKSKIRQEYKNYIKTSSALTPKIETVTSAYKIITSEYTAENIQKENKVQKPAIIIPVSKKAFIKKAGAYSGV